MGRIWTFAVVAVGGALAVSGCGATTTVTETAGLRLAAEAPSAAPAAVEPTDGRLGDASAIRAGRPPRDLSAGGRLDVRPRRDAPRRDGVGAGAACANPGLAPAPATLSAIADATLCLLNGERADHGLPPLAANDKLAGAATAYAADLVAGSYFSHTGRDGSGVAERIERSGYLPPDAGWALGENLAWGTGGLATPASIMQAWMNSPGHRENILNPDYREIGVGVVVGNPAQPDGLGATYATEFGVIEGVEEDEAEPVASTPPRTSDRTKHRSRKARKRARRHRLRARNARRAHQARRGGKGRGKPHGRRIKLRGPTAHIAI